MAKIDYIKLSKVRDDGTAELIVRLYVTKAFRPQFKSNLFINPKRFVSMDATDRCRHYRIDIPRKGKLNYNEVKDLELVEAKFATYLKRLQRICDVTEEKHKDELTTEWISNALWKSHATLTLLAKQDLPTFGYNMIDPLKSWCWGSILFYPFKISRFS